MRIFKNVVRFVFWYNNTKIYIFSVKKINSFMNYFLIPASTWNVNYG